ncbi:MAG: GNAT family N-acetyltransferase [Firmicutes bacterium]|nr:GNAT family N-acetyltransferase [Bacillota bacterium]
MEQIVIYSESLKDAVFSFTEKCFSNLGKAFQPEGRHAYYHHLEEEFDRFWCLVSEEAVVGTVGVQRLDDQTAELKALYLSENLRGRGLGYRLLDTAVAFAKDSGYRRIVLDSMSKYESAARLYKKYGFQETARYNENPYADVFMKLDLQEKI